MARPSNLPEPWLSLAHKLGGAYPLYEAMLARSGVPVTTAKRVCRGTGLLNFEQWKAISALFRENGIAI